MFGFDWPELIIIGIVALVFIGPEDLPDMFRQLGRFTAKLRQMSREFSRAMEQAAKDTGVSDVARDLKTSTSVSSIGLDKVREAADKFEKWDPIKNAAKPFMTTAATMPARSLTPPPMPATPGTATPGIAPVSPPMAEVSALTSAAERDAVLDDAAEAEDDLAAHGEELAEHTAAHSAEIASEPTIHGPATQALYDKQAMRAQVLAEQTEKLKAIEAGTYAPAASPEVMPMAEAPKPEPLKTKAKAEVATDTAVSPLDGVESDAPEKISKKKADNA